MLRNVHEKILLNKAARVKDYYYPIVHRLAELPGTLKIPELVDLKKRDEAIREKYQKMMLCIRDIDIYKADIQKLRQELDQQLDHLNSNYDEIDQLTNDLLNMPELVCYQPAGVYIQLSEVKSYA